MKYTKKTRLKKQLISGGIYIALAAAVIGVTTNTVANLISGTTDSIPDVSQTKYQNIPSELPNLPEISLTPSSSDTPTQVSGTTDGINAQITQDSSLSDNTPDEISKSNTQESAQSTVQPDFGYPGYVKPCGAIISREYSDDVLVYSPTMYDYRVHTGVDIASELATPVKAVSGGIVTDISFDDMLGQTVTITSPDGLELRYCNLSEELSAIVKKDAVIQTGQIIGGIGQTALCEAAEAPHLHLEAVKNGESFDPATLFTNAADTQAANAVSALEFE